MKPETFDFIGGDRGPWKIVSQHTLSGNPLPAASYLTISPHVATQAPKGVWTLTGVTSNVRYAEKAEREKLAAVHADLGRPFATCAALIPMGKNEAWWSLAQDERRKIFESVSHHTETGLRFSPAIARKLFHARDLGQPFDFLTWFEYAPEDAGNFEELVSTLRKTAEWSYVDREIDIRLVRV